MTALLNRLLLFFATCSVVRTQTMGRSPNDTTNAAQRPNRFSRIEIAIMVAIAVLLVASARPMLHRLRESAQQKGVLNNLHAISAASENYFLESGLTSVSSSELVGTHSSQYIRQLLRAADESYCPIIVKGEPLTATGIAGARTITFSN